jgi:hypothetical protein
LRGLVSMFFVSVAVAIISFFLYKNSLLTDDSS